jgi:beta-glucanase (GH16 family)
MFLFGYKILTGKLNVILIFAFIFCFWGFAGKEIFAQKYQLVWADEFNGTKLDSTKWSYQIGNRHGWGNHEKEYYTSENAIVKDGYLTIIAKKENRDGFDYTSSRIHTINKGDWKYGKFEMRAKLPIGKGMWPAFWMMPTKSVYGGWPVSGEMDIMEYLGNDSTTVYGTLHYGGRPPDNKHTGKSFKLVEGDFHNQFHTFTLIWERGKVQWLVDDSLYQTQTEWYTTEGEFPAPFDQEFHIILNMAVGGDWPGYPDESTRFPQKFIVDYVRVYQEIADSTKNN